jgi:predicted DNA-binding protein
MYETKRTNIYLTDPSVAKLQELAKQTGLSVAELIRRAIDEFLNKKK